jgi:polyhydroxyalkanoate synthase
MTQATSLLSSHLALPHWKSGLVNWKPLFSLQEAELRQQVASSEAGAFHRALSEESARRVAEFLKGVRAYRNHPYRRDLAPMPVVWQQGSSRLIDYGQGGGGPPLLLVPSLINRAYVLDLTARRSLLRWLAGQGFRPFLVDWGSPGADEREFGLEDYVAGRLSAMLDHVLAAAGPPVLLGYCMGGLLGLGLAGLRQGDLAGLVLLATPWDFHRPLGRSARQLQSLEPALRDALAQFQQMPADLLQILFALQDPGAIERKFRQFAQLRPKSAAARNFVALEDWVNDCVPLTAKVAEETLFGWYGENRPALGQWRVAGQVIDPGRITLPSLVMVPARDRIVPAEQALPLARTLPAAKAVLVEGGHVGMLLGARAVTEIYAVIGRAIRRMARSGSAAI